MNKKLATTYYQINDLIEKRWSPRAFKETVPPKDQIMKLLEAARWAPSCFNEQPWRFIIGVKNDSQNSYEKIFSCLHEFNQNWAEQAPVLMLVCTKKAFDHNQKLNKHYMYDCGAAMANLYIQATEDGLHVHQMAGIDPSKAAKLFNVPEGFEVITGVAIGYLGDPETLEEKNRKSEEAERTRKPIDEILFINNWGEGFD